MNRVFFAILFLALAAAISCSTENEDSFEEQINVAESLSFQGSGGSFTMDLLTNGVWEARSSEKWCKIIPSGGSGRIMQKQDFTVICDPNDTRADRVCFITISTPNKSAKVHVSQETEKGVYLPAKEIHTTTAAKTFRIEYWFNEPVSVEVSKDCESWLGIMPSSRNLSADEVTLSVSENYSAKRTGTVLFKSPSKTDKVAVIQDADDIYIPDENLRHLCSSKFDLDEDGCISRNEAKSVRSLYIPSNSEIRSLDGIEQFTELIDIKFYLDCYKLIPNVRFWPFKYLRSVCLDSAWFNDADFTRNKMLSSLYLKDCIFVQKVNVSGLSSLSRIQIFSLLHGFIDLSGCTALKDVDIEYNNSLSELNLSDATNLETLNCMNNPNLKVVYLKKRPKNLYYDPSVTSIVYVE